MLKVLLVFIILFGLSWGGSVKVATSANVSYAVEELIKEFRKLYPDVKVQKIVSSSGKLTAQIIHKAPYDIFLSANLTYPKKLYKMGLCSEPKVYAKGFLVIFSRKERDFSKGIKILEDNSIKKIAIANPKLAPYGKASITAIKKAELYPKTKQKIIFADSISQTLSYALKVADLGVVAKSLVLSPKMSKYKRGINWIDLDSKFYSPIEQGVVIINHSKDAVNFFRFLFSENAKRVLKKYGYNSP